MSDIFNQLNKFFDKIFVISLKKSEDRHSFVKSHLDELNFEFFWGVDGRKFTLEELENKGIYNHDQYNLNRIVKGEKPRLLNLGRVGCALSHLSIYRLIVKNNFQKVLILEDDIYIKKSISDKFEKAVSELPDKWDLLYLGHYGANSEYTFKSKIKYALHHMLSAVNLRKYDPYEYRRLFQRSYSEHISWAGAHWGTHAYAVTLEGAKKLIKYHQPITKEVDNLLTELCRYELIKAFSLREKIFFQTEELPSTIIN